MPKIDLESLPIALPDGVDYDEFVIGTYVVSYPAAIHVGDVLTAVADLESRTRRLGFYRVRVTNQDHTAVALFRGTVYQTKQEHP